MLRKGLIRSICNKDGQNSRSEAVEAPQYFAATSCRAIMRFSVIATALAAFATSSTLATDRTYLFTLSVP